MYLCIFVLLASSAEISCREALKPLTKLAMLGTLSSQTFCNFFKTVCCIFVPDNRIEFSNPLLCSPYITFSPTFATLSRAVFSTCVIRQYQAGAPR